MPGTVLYRAERAVWEDLVSVSGIKTIFDKRHSKWIRMLRKTSFLFEDLRDDQGQSIRWHPREVVQQTTILISVTERKLVEEVQKLNKKSEAQQRLYENINELTIHIGGINFDLANKIVFLALGIIFESTPHR